MFRVATHGTPCGPDVPVVRIIHDESIHSNLCRANNPNDLSFCARLRAPTIVVAKFGISVHRDAETGTKIECSSIIDNLATHCCKGGGRRVRFPVNAVVKVQHEVRCEIGLLHARECQSTKDYPLAVPWLAQSGNECPPVTRL